MRRKLVVLFVSIIGLFIGFTFAEKNCSLEALGYKDYKVLFSGLQQPPKSDEDLGRYIGFGWRKFKGFGADILKIIFGKGCHSIYSDAQFICEKFESILDNSKSLNELKNILDNFYKQLPENTKGKDLVGKFIKDIANFQTGNVQILIKRFYNDILKIRQYYQYRTIKITDDAVYIPYTYLIPLNITYNRSIQNLSSYYTDIGYVWLVMWLIILLGFVYSIFIRNKFLFSITFVSISGYILWWLVGSGILWYGIGLVIWTILSTLITLYYFIKNSDGFIKYGYMSVIVILVIFFFGQLFLNFIRISSQGGKGPFAWYKNNLGKVTKVNDFLQVEQVFKFPYIRKDIFDIQFPHYNKFIQAANNRKPGENIFLAGTYARYFIKDQKGLVYDQMLVNLRKRMSDWNTCKTYLRLAKAKGFKYIAIDPNIGTVTDFVNKGNKTLFDRFYGNINLDTWHLDQWGVLTFLGKMYEDGYVKYFYSNNLAAKYGFVLSDNDLMKLLKAENPNLTGLTKDDLAIVRGSLVAIRYPWVSRLLANKFFSGDINKVYDFIIKIALYRINTNNFVSDIADYYGKSEVDLDKLKVLLVLYFKKDINNFKKGITYLNNDERLVLFSTLNIILSLKQANNYKPLQDIVFGSISSPSQIFVLQLK